MLLLKNTKHFISSLGSVINFFVEVLFCMDPLTAAARGLCPEDENE